MHLNGHVIEKSSDSVSCKAYLSVDQNTFVYTETLKAKLDFYILASKSILNCYIPAVEYHLKHRNGDVDMALEIF